MRNLSGSFSNWFSPGTKQTQIWFIKTCSFEIPRNENYQTSPKNTLARSKMIEIFGIWNSDQWCKYGVVFNCITFLFYWKDRYKNYKKKKFTTWHLMVFHIKEAPLYYKVAFHFRLEQNLLPFLKKHRYSSLVVSIMSSTQSFHFLISF